MSRLSATTYRAQFTPAPRIEPEVVVVSDADEEEPMEVEVKPPTLTNAPTSTPMVVPIPPVDAPVPTATHVPTSSAASCATLSCSRGVGRDGVDH
jgi:hypothetical protein